MRESLGETPRELQHRIIDTLYLFSEWGHAATVEILAQDLLGGAVDAEMLRILLPKMQGVLQVDGVVGLEGQGPLLTKTERRHRSHQNLKETYLDVAREFTHDLTRWCPFVQCVALTGSLANGGFDEGDDIDFDLFVESGTKYICYLLGVLLGVKYAWAFRGREVHRNHQTPLLPKITCLNVVWQEDETRPFTRRDAPMAYEMLRCRPLLGVDRFQAVLRDNSWLAQYFPQLYRREWKETVSGATLNAVGQFLDSLRRFPWALRVLEAACRGLSWVIYRFVQWTRRDDPEAVRRMEFLRRVKYPYEVFQD